MRPPPRREITVAQQAFLMRTSPWVGGNGCSRRDILRWDFSVRPTVASRTYSIHLEYRRHHPPRVYVRAPDLVALADNRKLPHVYSEHPTRLCLYLPETGEWHRGLSIAATIVPWTYLWLDYYEEWLISDEWKGGGLHPAVEPAHPQLH